MASSSGRKSGSSGRSTPRKRVVIGAEETVRVRYAKNKPQVEAERRSASARTKTKPAGGTKRSAAGRRLSDAKREERERRQRSQRLRRVGIVLAAVAAGVVLIWLLNALYRAPVFVIEDVVVTGASRLSRAEVIERAGLSESATLLRFPGRSVEKRIERSPWVIDASVDRDFPNTLRIVIKERVPAAVVDAGGADLWLLATDGVWIGKRSAEDTGLVVVRDLASIDATAGTKAEQPELKNALKIIAGLSPELRAQIRSISAPSVDKTALVTVDDVEVFVGTADDLAKKDRIAREILETYKGKVVYVNVRVVDSPTWRGLDE